MCIKTDVLSLLKKYRTNDPFMIAKEKNVIVLYYTKILVVSWDIKTTIYAFISVTKNDKIKVGKRFICVYEFVYVVLHY